MIETKEITPATYANWYGCKPQYIHKLLKDERLDLLPNIIEVKKYSRFYVLIVPQNVGKETFRRINFKNAT